MKSSGKTIHKAYWQLLAGLALIVLALALTLPEQENADETTDAPLRVVATIAPLHALTAGVTEGVAEPYQLLKAGDTPHHFNLKPQDAERIAHADAVVTLGLKTEYYLNPLLTNLKDKDIAVVQAVEAPHIRLLPAADNDAHGGHGEHDIHLWLDPQNAIAITRYIAETLAARDPANAGRYRENAARQIVGLEALDAETASLFAGRTDKNAAYVIYHPVLRYFERRYGIEAAQKTVAAVPEAGASAAEAATLERALNEGEYRCILQETEFSSKLLARMAEKHPQLKTLTIDPLGNQFPPSAELYARLIRHVTETLIQCLK